MICCADSHSGSLISARQVLLNSIVNCEPTDLGAPKKLTFATTSTIVGFERRKTFMKSGDGRFQTKNPEDIIIP